MNHNIESVYLETTIISYLASRPSRDLLVAAHQQITEEWWRVRSQMFDCYVSQVVIEETSVGDYGQAKKRMEIINTLPVLEATSAAEELTRAILARRIMPSRAVRDAAHIAVAAVNSVDYLLTWNCKHIANAQLMRKVEKVCIEEGHNMPLICTPEELMGG